MAGTKEGGRAAAATNKSKYGKDYYQKIGAMGGKLGRTGGFASNREAARYYGTIGGSISRRGTRLSADDRIRLRKQIERNFAHLQKVADKAKKARLAAVQ